MPIAQSVEHTNLSSASKPTNFKSYIMTLLNYSIYCGCQQIRFSHLIKHPMKFIPCLCYTVSVIAVNNKNKALSVLEVVPPQRSDLF